MFGRNGWKLLVCAGILAGATTATYGQPFVQPVTGFELAEGFAEGDEVLFQEPSFSGSTQGIFLGTDFQGLPWNNSQVAPFVPFPGTGTESYEILFMWDDPTNSNGMAAVRATTFAAANLQRPSLHLGGKVRFKMAVTAFQYDAVGNTFGAQITAGASILMCLGIKETGNDIAQGETDTGAGDIEFVYLPGSEVLPVTTNGLIAEWPPGGKRFAAASEFWPGIINDWVAVEFDLAQISSNGTVLGFANDGNGVDTAGDGVLDATLNPGGEGINRGVLEGLFFTNDPVDLTGKIFAIYIDDIEFESPVADPVAPPSIQAPVSSADTQVLVDTRPDASSAKLFIDGSSNGVPAVTPVSGVATFTGLSLSPGNILTATQTANGITSALSLPVVVFAPGTVLADSFDSYASQADLNQFWFDSFGAPVPADAIVQLRSGSAASCENLLWESNPSGSDAARLYRSFGGANGTDAQPLWMTWYFKHDINHSNARTRFELARFTDGLWSVGARAEGSTGIAVTNEIAGPLLSEYGIMLKSTDPRVVNTNGPVPVGTNGFEFSSNLLWAPTGVPRAPGVWHKMQVEVRSTTLNYYIDDQLVNPPAFTIAGGATSNGVPRPNGSDYQFVIVGQGFSNNGPTFFYDNISLTTGTTPLPFGDPKPPAPAIVEPLLPGGTSVSLIDINSNATQVAVYRNGSATPDATAAGPFLTNTATLTVPTLSDGNGITATQTLAAVESCDSVPVTVAAPAPTVEPPLVPGQTSVQVSNLNEGLASAVTVYVDLGGGSKLFLGDALSPATDPIAVTVPGLVNGDIIVATQTIGGAESADSAGVTVAVPAPTLPGPLSVGDLAVTVDGVHPAATSVAVLVNGTTNGLLDVSTSGAPSVDVTLGTSLFVDDTVTARQTIGGVKGPLSNAITVALPMCLIVYEDDFETDTSASWNVNITDDAGLNDAAATFAFDYSAAGIPPSPNGVGTTLGLKFEVNQFDITADQAAVTASPIGQTFLAASGYRLLVDMWINANGPFPAGGAGSTEFFSSGVGYDNLTANLGFGATAGGSGAWFAITGESGASRDVRGYKDGAEQFPASGQYVAGTVSGVHNNTNNHQYYFDLFGTPAPPAAQTALFPAQTGNLLTGSAGFAWHAVDITALGTKARWSVNDTPIVIIDTTIGTPFSGLDGNISLGYQDIFSSISGDPTMSFGLADNVRILVPHTPGTNGDYDGNAVLDTTDHRYFTDCMAGPGVAPDPSTGQGCRNVCLDVFDTDADGDLDLKDWATFQDNF